MIFKVILMARFILRRHAARLLRLSELRLVDLLRERGSTSSSLPVQERYTMNASAGTTMTTSPVLKVIWHNSTTVPSRGSRCAACPPRSRFALRSCFPTAPQIGRSAPGPPSVTGERKLSHRQATRGADILDRVSSDEPGGCESR